MTTLFDPGLQPERTELAWRRSALAVGVGSLVALRLLPESLGSAWWTLVGLLGLGVAVALWIYARARYNKVNDSLAPDGTWHPLPDALALMILTSLVVAFGVLGAALVIVVSTS